MTPPIIITFEELYQKIADLAREDSVFDQEKWDDFVDEVVDGYIDMGAMNLDQDTEGYKESLSPLWKRFKQEAREEENSREDELGPRINENDDSTVEEFPVILKKDEEEF